VILGRPKEHSGKSRRYGGWIPAQGWGSGEGGWGGEGYLEVSAEEAAVAKQGESYRVAIQQKPPLQPLAT